jgi:hypothetical protein
VGKIAPEQEYTQECGKTKCATHGPAVAQFMGLRQSVQDGAQWRSEMDEFGGGFLRNAMIGFALALAFSIIYVWYTR